MSLTWCHHWLFRKAARTILDPCLAFLIHNRSVLGFSYLDKLRGVTVECVQSNLLSNKPAKLHRSQCAMLIIKYWRPIVMVFISMVGPSLSFAVIRPSSHCHSILSSGLPSAKGISGVQSAIHKQSRRGILASISGEADEPEPTSKLGPKAPPPGFLRTSFPHFPWHRLPNFLTYARFLSIPALMVLFYQTNRHVETAAVFAIGSFTDWLDGFLARRWDIASSFGAFLDPVVDKLMVSTCLILLSGEYGPIVAIPSAVILAREIAVSALREWMAERGKRDLVKVGFQGKVKTAATMCALSLLLLVPRSGKGNLALLFPPGLVCLYLCTFITITSGSVYFRGAAPTLMSGT